MITEDYVSFEIAKLLKEKGFDEPCYAYWHEGESRLIISQSIHAIQNITNPCFFGPAAPTHQMACKWLREVNGLFISISNDGIDYNWQIINVKNNRTGYLYPTYLTEPHAGYKTYEDAVEAALKYSLSTKIFHEP